MCDLLFVYGSLRSGFDNIHARRLRAESRFKGAAVASGAVVQNGAYPGFLPGDDGEVAGELYRMDDAAATLAHLDDYEGPEYPRVVIRLQEPAVDAWVYRLRA